MYKMWLKWAAILVQLRGRNNKGKEQSKKSNNLLLP
jgi:hypothetical protein